MHSPEVVAVAGCTSVRALRHWEDLGLFGEVFRTSGDQRRYTDEQIKRARIIAAGQFGGFELDKLKDMLDAYDTDPQVYEALVQRLFDQSRAIGRLMENLPKPKPAKQEFDL